MDGGQFEFDPDGSEFKRWQKISNTKSREWSMVAIRDSTSSVFPPINHENLHLPTSPSLSSSSSSSLSSFSPSDSDESGPVSPTKVNTQVGKCSELRSWVGLGVGLLRSRILGIGGLVKRWGFSSGYVVAVVFMVWSFYLRVKQRRYRRRCELVIKEKDEKISKLLNQIAQLNEVLVARHRVLASKLAN
uniref:uncharacterized protein LOC101296664 n=1 Tax=Fragaria vesca subsp. vesca TaxID=101020 RepID=UPI0005CA142D|nr:PREDICTED: uncharacterized protein LOC101296664 [Fragaria vesca subsp. vesca]